MILLPTYCTEEGWFGGVGGVCFFKNIAFPLERILNNIVLDHISQSKML